MSVLILQTKTNKLKAQESQTNSKCAVTKSQVKHGVCKNTNRCDYNFDIIIIC